MEKVIVQEYGLDAFVTKIAELAANGYKVDLQSNEGYPRQIGVVYTTIMLKEVTEVKEEVKRGKKAS